MAKSSKPLAQGTKRAVWEGRAEKTFYGGYKKSGLIRVSTGYKNGKGKMNYRILIAKLSKKQKNPTAKQRRAREAFKKMVKRRR